MGTGVEKRQKIVEAPCIDLPPAIFVYSNVCKAKRLKSMCISKAGPELCKTCTVVVEVKYFSTKNVVIHTQNCKLELPLDCSTTQMEKTICRMCDMEESSRRGGFADFAIKVFYTDFIEAGSSRKASFVLRIC